MREFISKLPVISLGFAVVSFTMMITASPLNIRIINLATILDIIGLILAIISLFNSNCKKVCAVLAIAFCLTSFTVKSNLENRRNNSNIFDYTNYRDPILDINSYFPNITTQYTTNSSTENSSTEKPSTDNSSTDNNVTNNITSDNTFSDNTNINN